MNLREYVEEHEDPARITSRDEMRIIIAAHQAIALEELARAAAVIADQLREIRLEIQRMDSL